MILSLPLVVVTCLLVLALLYQFRRRAELQAMRRDMEERAEAVARGSDKAQLQYPHIDLSRCLGCGACVRACPEEGVLGLIHGQAAVLHGARCVGHAACASACPVDAITVALGDLQGRKDIPALSSRFEVPDVPGLYLGGEVTGHALIRTAIAHGEAIADDVARRLEETKPKKNGVLDLCIVGAGPAGFACSLQAKARGLKFVTIDRESLGGTVAKYPRRKLVMTQPVRLPLHGTLSRTSFEKEELMALWSGLAKKHALPIRSGVEFTGLDRDGEGRFVVHTSQGDIGARSVVLALGRRGTPRKLGVPGEELPKVTYNLVDAQGYRGRRVLVVGGGDSAIEAALALAEQPGNRVSLSYRQAAFSRLKAKNEKRIAEAIKSGRVTALFESNVVEIAPDRVRLSAKGKSEQAIANDDVFVMAGGVPPFALLEKAGVSFDPTKAAPQPEVRERGTEALKGIVAALLWAAAAWVWFAAFRSYYALGDAARAMHPWHALLRASGGFGLWCGIAATAVIGANLLYLVRRAFLWIPGSLRAWMTSHIMTGTLAFLLVWMHAGMRPQQTSGGYGFWMLGVLALTGVVGRYFYAYVPRAANGRELRLEELRNEIASQSAEWDRQGRGFGEEARAEIQKLAESASVGFLGLVRQGRRLRRTIATLRARGRERGLSPDQVRMLVALAERTHATALASGRFEQVRGVMSAWRYLHRTIAFVLLVLVAIHVGVALRYANLLR